MTEKHKFKCRECGFEVYLQAWKAVCPSCDGTYTLEKVPEKDSILPVIYKLGMLSGFSFMAYFVMLPIIVPNITLLGTLLDLFPSFPRLVAYVAMLIISISIMARSTVGIVVSLPLWGISAIYHALSLATQVVTFHLPLLILTLISPLLSIVVIYLMGRKLKLSE